MKAWERQSAKQRLKALESLSRAQVPAWKQRKIADEHAKERAEKLKLQREMEAARRIAQYKYNYEAQQRQLRMKMEMIRATELVQLAERAKTIKSLKESNDYITALEEAQQLIDSMQ